MGTPVPKAIKSDNKVFYLVSWDMMASKYLDMDIPRSSGRDIVAGWCWEADPVTKY